ncbi:hypothetical protein YC2023_028020 [Brassica napus]
MDATIFRYRGPGLLHLDYFSFTQDDRLKVNSFTLKQRGLTCSVLDHTRQAHDIDKPSNNAPTRPSSCDLESET